MPVASSPRPQQRPDGQRRDANKYPPRRADDHSVRPGRRTRFTEEQLAHALRHGAGFHSGACTILQAAYGHTVSVNTMGRLIASSPRLQAVKAQITRLVLDYAELALLRKIEAVDNNSIHFYLRFKGASRGYAQSHRHAGDTKCALIKTETTLNFDGVPIDKLREIYDVLTKAREAAVDAARDAAERDE